MSSNAPSAPNVPNVPNAHNCPRPRPRRRLWPFVAVIVLAWAIVGCTSTITPPQHPVDPVAVYVLLDDRHQGLILPRREGGYVEYGYGEWQWYAMAQDQWYRAFPAMLWPTQGTLARREIAAADATALQQQLSWMKMHPIQVSRSRAQNLLATLDAQFGMYFDQVHRSTIYHMDFVPHAEGYWLFHNCYDAVARWLEALGCGVSFVPVRLGMALN